MNKWYVNIANKMSVLWYGLEPDLVVEYKSVEVGDWIAMGVPTDIGDNIHTIEHTFDNLGNFLIRVRDVNTGDGIIDKLVVEIPTAEEVCGCVTESTNAMRSEIATLDSGLRQVLSQVTDEVNENQTIMEKTGFIVTI